MGDIPTVKIFKDGKMMICNKSDFDRFKKEGWALQESESPKRVKGDKDNGEAVAP
jgi:hypothetical protein